MLQGAVFQPVSGGGGGGGSSVTLVSAFSAADQSIISSTAFTSATDLQLVLPSAGTYAIEGFITWFSNATADLKIRFSGGTTLKWQGDWNRATALTVGTASLLCQGNNTADRSTPIRGLIPVTGATTLQFQFGQNVSTAVNTIIRANSWIYALKL